MRVSALWIYPVKSLRGLRVDRARALPEGLEHDRRWMVVRRGQDGALAFVTQREEAGLVRIRASVEDGAVVLRAHGAGALALPRTPTCAREAVTVWRSTLPATVWYEADEWLARATGLEGVHLAMLPPDVSREVTSRAGRPGDVVSFADAFPYLFASDASLADLNIRLAAPVTMERFRPSIVVEGGAPWEEDGWSSLSVGSVDFEARKPCDRCIVTTVDPETGIKGKEPLSTLATFRERDHGVWFGVNFVARTAGEIHVGDEVFLRYAPEP